ncbi:hypothetical protein F5878DRAFT_636789 [Lentinula raphanica]|uniref:Uncharacterized protein n=1 Tax=Lentinula raphanica TaxID=153919 RepID=A0AA38PMI9_9AGAR|nr:hypothetical protein F5878DRAFT_636789 [Lentinula raphanica]
MNNDRATEVNLEQRLPNEISDLIVSHLVNDPSSLRNVALLCHDSASIAQPYIFRQVDLKDVPNPSWSKWSGHRRNDYVPLIHRFAALLDNPQTAFLGRFVRRLDLNPCSGPLRDVEHAELDVTISSIFERLPLLTELRISRGRPAHLTSIQLYLSKQLRKLWIEHMAIYVEDGYEQLQNMLTSCTHLTFLALHDCSLDSSITRAECTTLPLILPSSLEKACVTRTNERTFDALGLGLKFPQAPVLSSFLSDFRNEVEDRSQLWQGLGQHTLIVLDVGNMLSWPNSLTTSSWSRFDPLTSYIPAMISVTQGIVSSELTLHCSQQYQLVSYFAHFISVLPDPVRRIRINFNARASDGPLDRDPDSWVKLDNALMKRHALGVQRELFLAMAHRMKMENYSTEKSWIVYLLYSIIQRRRLGEMPRNLEAEQDGALAVSFRGGGAERRPSDEISDAIFDKEPICSTYFHTSIEHPSSLVSSFLFLCWSKKSIFVSRTIAASQYISQFYSSSLMGAFLLLSTAFTTALPHPSALNILPNAVSASPGAVTAVSSGVPPSTTATVRPTVVATLKLMRILGLGDSYSERVARARASPSRETAIEAIRQMLQVARDQLVTQSPEKEVKWEIRLDVDKSLYPSQDSPVDKNSPDEQFMIQFNINNHEYVYQGVFAWTFTYWDPKSLNGYFLESKTNRMVKIKQGKVVTSGKTTKSSLKERLKAWMGSSRTRLHQDLVEYDYVHENV